ncbi:MAG: zeta toxin family protein [Peptococcaceae bacterium]|nr:zeta toxin family protein [Peptococcaceae bacterium]
MSNANAPVLWIFAGPNGSGKSSITSGIYAESPDIPETYINADVIAQERGIGALEAASIAQAQRDAAFEARGSFVMETVMSMPDKIDLMRQAKTLGYQVRLIYVTTQDPKINVRRVKWRHEAGGHDVPTDKIFSRYDRSMGYLPEAFAIADAARIYNNSFDDPVLLVEKTPDNIVLYEQAPPSKWTRANILALIGMQDNKEPAQEDRYFDPSDAPCWPEDEDR